MEPDLLESVEVVGASSVLEIMVLHRTHSRVRMSVIAGLALVRRFACFEFRLSFWTMRTLKRMFEIVSFALSIARYRCLRAAFSRSSSSGVGERIEEVVAVALAADLEVAEEGTS